MRHGRIENPVPEWLRDDFFRKAHTRVKRGDQLQWYSRHSMWIYAEKLGKDSVEALSDAEFIDGLNVVHKHFKSRVSQRVAWNIEAQKGPLTLEDRSDPEKLNYLGTPFVYKYYDQVVFPRTARYRRVAVT